MNDKSAKLKALQTTIDNLEKTYGKGTVMRLGDNPAVDIDVISTGSLGLDIALGIGGFPKGRIVEVLGMESGGKTTLTLHAIAECQKGGGTAAFIDAEMSFDPHYAKKLGVDIDNLIISQPSAAEDALEIVEGLVRSGGVDLIIIDSVAALVPKAEIEGTMGESKVGVMARLMSQAMRKLTGPVHQANCCCIFINQLREKIGIQFGNPEVSTGGNALKFYASVRLDIRKSGTQVKDKDGNVVAAHVKAKVIKNKLSAPYRAAEFDIEFGTGISKAGELVDLGTQFGILDKSGSWYSYNGAKVAQGRDASKQFMLDNPEVAAEIEEKIKEAVGKG